MSFILSGKSVKPATRVMISLLFAFSFTLPALPQTVLQGSEDPTANPSLEKNLPAESSQREPGMYRFRLEVGGFDNHVSNQFGHWWGGGLNLSSKLSDRLTLSGQLLTQRRPGETEQLLGLTALVNWSPSLYSNIALSGGGPDTPAAFFPRVRYDATINWKVPRISGLILNGGLARLYFGAPNNGRVLEKMGFPGNRLFQ